MSGGFRYFAGAVAFGFAAVWIMASLLAALVCLSAAVVGYGGVAVAERRRGRPARAASRDDSTPGSSPVKRKPASEDLPQWAETLNSDLGHVYEPAAITSPFSAGAAYGWPVDDDTRAISETPH